MGIRDYLGIAALLALLGGGVYVNHLRVQAGKYEVAQAALTELRAAHDEYKAQHEQLDAEKAKASQGYIDEATKLRAANAAAPVPAVRLCSNPPRTSLPTAAHAAARSGAGASAAGLVQPGATPNNQAGPDIGPALDRLAERADTLAAQCRAAIHFNGGR